MESADEHDGIRLPKRCIRPINPREATEKLAPHTPGQVQRSERQNAQREHVVVRKLRAAREVELPQLLQLAQRGDVGHGRGCQVKSGEERGGALQDQRGGQPSAAAEVEVLEDR